MSAGARASIAAVDVARALVAFGLVPLLFVASGSPWSFALTPTWSIQQLVFVASAGVGLGAIAGRPAQGLAGVTLGVVVGLGVDLWWLAGWVEPYDQAFVSELPATEWRQMALWAAFALVGAVAAGFLVGAVARRVWRHATWSPGRPTGDEAVAIGLVVVGTPLLALGVASAVLSPALLVPDEAQVQVVVVSAAAIAVDPAILRPGPTRFRCHFAPDARPEWARLVAQPEGAGAGAAASPPGEDLAACISEAGGEAWGTIADLPPGRYVWTQSEPLEVPVTISTSPVFVVAR